MKKVFQTIAMTFCLCMVAFTSKTMAQDVDVYVAGNIGNRAVVWKNGEVINLTNGTKTAVAYSVYVSDNDVYVVGYEAKDDYSYVAKIWKNGIATNLTDGSYRAAAKSVFVLGNDVYVAGYACIGSNSKNIAKVWKNGVETNFTDGAIGYANSVFVLGNDVYVAGSKGASPIVWKNGVATFLSNSGMSNVAHSIFVSENAVYAAGYSEFNNRETAILWENGEKTNLTPVFSNSAKEARAFSVFVVGSDVYVAGYEDNRINDAGGTTYASPSSAKVWRNGTATKLTDGTKYAQAHSVYVSENDVYVVGYEEKEVSNFGSNKIAKIWKNGVETALTDGTNNACAYSVFVAYQSTDIDEIQVAKDINIYPNPATDELKIDIDNGTEIDAVEICDVLGRKMINITSSNCNTINVSSLCQGIYAVKIHTQKGIIVKKFLKE